MNRLTYLEYFYLEEFDNEEYIDSVITEYIQGCINVGYTCTKKTRDDLVDTLRHAVYLNDEIDPVTKKGWGYDDAGNYGFINEKLREIPEFRIRNNEELIERIDKFVWNVIVGRSGMIVPNDEVLTEWQMNEGYINENELVYLLLEEVRRMVPQKW